MVSGKFIIKNEQGLHMRPAGVLSKAAAKYPCHVKINVSDKEVNAKSIMLIMGACIKCGTEIELVCDGEGEAEAFEEIKNLIESGFGE